MRSRRLCIAAALLIALPPTRSAAQAARSVAPALRKVTSVEGITEYALQSRRASLRAEETELIPIPGILFVSKLNQNKARTIPTPQPVKHRGSFRRRFRVCLRRKNAVARMLLKLPVA